MYHFYDPDSKAHFTVRFLVILHVVSLATVTQCKPTACACKDIVVMIALLFQMCPLKIENGTLGNMPLLKTTRMEFIYGIIYQVTYKLMFLTRLLNV